MDVVVTDLVSVKSSRKVLTYANGDNTMYMDHLFICRPDPNGNTEPFVGDEESLSVGWFSPDALPEPLAATTVERMAYVREYLRPRRMAIPMPSLPSTAPSAEIAFHTS